MERFEWRVRIHLTNWVQFDFNMDAEEILNLWKKLRDYSFVNIKHWHFNKINISHIEFPNDIMLEELMSCLNDKDCTDVDFLNEWTFVEKDLSLNIN